MKKIVTLLALIAMICSTFCFAAEIKQDKVIEVRLGQNFTITLKSNPTTGYKWQTAEPIDESTIQLISSDYVSEGVPGIVGQGGKEVWTFKALKEGKTTIYFKYVRSWEKGIAPVQEESYTVIIKR